MAELQTPSAAAISTMDPTAPTAEDTKATPAAKPEKPDEVAFKAALEKARKVFADAQEFTKTAQARVNSARPGNKDSPLAQRQQDLRAQLSEIRTKQQGFKTSRVGTHDKLKALDTQLKNKITEHKTSRAKIPFKSAEEIDREISSLEQQVDSGKMKLVDEKKTLADITALRKQRKALAGFDDGQKSIDDLKAQINELRKELDNPEFKSLSDEYTKIATELDSLKAQQDGAFKDLNAARDALTKARGAQDEKWAAIKKLQDEYYQSRRAFMDYDREAARQREAKRKQERDAYVLEKKKRDLDRDLEEASWPAYAEEIRASENLMRLLDPSYTKSTAPTGPGAFAAVAQRTVDESGIKGTKLSKKDLDEEAYFVGGGGKKGKKGKKGTGASTPSTPTDSLRDLGRFFDPGVVKQFDLISLAPPASQEAIANVFQQVKEKSEQWIQDQSKKTQENIAAAQKKIDALLSGATTDATTDNDHTPGTPATTTTDDPAPAAASGESSVEALKQLAQEDGITESNSGAADDITEKLNGSSLADLTDDAEAATTNGHVEEA